MMLLFESYHQFFQSALGCDSGLKGLSKKSRSSLPSEAVRSLPVVGSWVECFID